MSAITSDKDTSTQNFDLVRTGLNPSGQGARRFTSIPLLRSLESKSSVVARSPGPTFQVPSSTRYAYSNVVGSVPFKEGVSPYGNVLENSQARIAFLKPFKDMLRESLYILELKDGWDDGEGYAPCKKTFDLVRNWVKEAARVLFDRFDIIELSPPELDPTPSGNITIYWALPYGKLHATVSKDIGTRVTYYLETTDTSGNVIDAKKGTYYESYRFLYDLPPLLATAAGAVPKNRWLDAGQ